MIKFRRQDFYLSWPLIILCLLTMHGRAFAQSKPRIVAEGSGYKKIALDANEHAVLFSKARAVSQLGQAQKSSTSVTNSSEVYQFTSLRGLRSSDLPAWTKQELLEDLGYSDWSAVSETALDSRIDPIAVDVDATNEIDVAINGSNTTVNTSQKANFKLFGFIEGCLHPETKTKSVSLSQPFHVSKPSDFSKHKDILQFDGEANFDAKGTVGAEVVVNIRTRCDIPYRAKLSYADLNLDAAIEGSLSIKGTATAKYSGNIIDPKRIELWRYYQSWIIYIFEVGLELDLGIDYGVKLDAQANVSVGTNYKTVGKIGLAWRCTSSDCSKTRSQSEISTNLLEKPEGALATQVKLTPYVDTNVTATMGLYGNFLELAKGKIGIVAAVPLAYNGYAGNLCSDADGDSRFEDVRGSMLDANFDIYGYINFEIGNKRLVRTIDLGVLGFSKPREITLYHDSNYTGTIFRKNLFFKDLISSGSTVLQPVISASAKINVDGSVSLTPRSCYPYEDKAIYEVDFGDGSPLTQVLGTNARHVWPDSGVYTVTARLIGDDVGRNFSSPSIRRQVNVTTDAATPPLGNMISHHTDASGKIIVDVFERDALVESARFKDFAVSVPSDYVAIGGGAEGAVAPLGHLLTASYPSPDLSTWFASSKEHFLASPAKLKVFVIGLKVEGLSRDELMDYIAVKSGTSPVSSSPEIAIALSSDFVMLGGGFKVNGTGAGNLATVSYPDSALSWRVKSKSHHDADNTTIDVYNIGIKKSLPGIGKLVTSVVSRQSAAAGHPLITVPLDDKFALTGCGAIAQPGVQIGNGSGLFGNTLLRSGHLLWKLKPASNGQGCDIGAKDHEYDTTGPLTGYAIGVAVE